MNPFNVILWQRGWIDDLSLSTIAKVCLAVLARFMNENGTAWPSLTTIARHASCSERSAIRHLQTADDSGWIYRTNKGGFGTIYHATTPDRESLTHDTQSLTPDRESPTHDTQSPLNTPPPLTHSHHPLTESHLPMTHSHMTPDRESPTHDTQSPKATTTSTTSTYLEAEEAREDFKTENEPESLDAFLMHVSERHGFQISIGQAMAVSGQLLTTLKTQEAVRNYASIRIAEKEGTGIKPGVLMRILAQDAPTWATSTTHNQHGNAPVQTSRIEVRGSGWSEEPKNAAWLDPANHLKVTKDTTDAEIDAAFAKRYS